MGYYEIENLYKDQSILAFKECYAMEKIHGTSAHISYTDGKVTFFAGGAKYEEFIKLFDISFLTSKLAEVSPPDTSVHVYGEAYGGKMQGMSKTYGTELKFVCFDVKIGNLWLSVPQAEDFCKKLNLEFVYYKKINVSLAEIETERDADSVQAIRNGIGEGHIREGIVLRPLEEYIKNNGRRIIAKHKRDEFRETRTPRQVTPEKLKVLTEAREIAQEWATEERLNHVLSTCALWDITQTGLVIQLMLDDIRKEAKDEVVLSKEAEKQIGRETALMFKRRLGEIK